MRLLQVGPRGNLMLTRDVNPPPAPYAILSHTWGDDDDEVTFDDLGKQTGTDKAGYVKLWFCVNQAAKDGLKYCWVDTCCINKASHSELDEAIRRMFRWYRDAACCYVYLSDVRLRNKNNKKNRAWKSAFRKSRWFTRGWTLQELLAPKSVHFFSKEEESLGTKISLEQQIHEITRVPVGALRGAPLSQFHTDERLQWVEQRVTKRIEDKAYCLLGIFQISMSLRYGEGDEAWKRLKEKISKGHGFGTHWIVTRNPNPLFTGRDDILQELGSIITNALTPRPYKDQCRIVVTGMGGQGKSEICLQLAHRLRSKFWGVFWIDASTTTLAETAFLDIGRTLSLHVQTWKEVCLGITNLKKPWLLVLDNADDPDVDYQPYIPYSSCGLVMVTSRNEDCQQYGTIPPVILEGLSAEAAQNLLLTAACVSVSERTVLVKDATRVAALLQSHPLALIQAGAYISRGHCRLDQYPAVYERQRQQLLQFRPTQAQSRYGNVYATFEASTDALKQSASVAARDALELLPLLAVCGARRLPMVVFKAGWEGARRIPSDRDADAADDEVELLTPWHVSRLPSLLDVSAEKWNLFRLVEAVQLLKAFALVTTDLAADSLNVSMHPLVHAWARDRQTVDEQHANWLSVGCTMAFAYQSGILTRTYDRQLQAHIESATEWECSTMFATAPIAMPSRVLVNCGWWLNRMRSDTKLSMLLHRLFTRLGLDKMTVKEAWLGLFKLASHNLNNCGQPKQAICLLEQVVKIQEQLIAEDHPDRLASQHELAGAYQANGQVKEAVALLTEVVQIKEQSLAEDHPDRLASQHELARVYRANGQVKEAVALLTEVVRIEEQSLAEDHPSRLASQHALATAYQANGQVNEAVALLTEVVQIKEQSLAEDHPSRLASQHELARVYRANGQVKEAVALLTEVVRIEEQSLAEDHPSRLASQHALATAYQANGQVKEAVALLTEVVRIREQSLVEDHPSRLASQLSLAVCLWEVKECERAHQLMSQVVGHYKQKFDADHPARQTSEQWLRWFQEDGEFSEGEDSMV